MNNNEKFPPLVSACQSAFGAWLRYKWTEYSSSSLELNFVDYIEDIKSFTYKEGAPTFPYIVMANAGIQLDTDRGGLSRRFSPIEVGIDRESGKGRLFYGTPVKVGLGLEFRADDTNDVLSMITLLYNTSPGPSIVLQLNDTGFMFKLRAMYPTDMDFPVAKQEDGEYTKMSVAIVVNSWIGKMEEIGTIKRINVRLLDSTKISELQYDETVDKWVPSTLFEKEITPTTAFASSE